MGIFDEKGQVVQRPYIWFFSSRLRECLAYELRVNNLPFPFDPERAIDDWVFMCFYVGNDFLPHLPSLDIREGAIDTLIDIYKQILPKTDGYLTENGQVCAQSSTAGARVHVSWSRLPARRLASVPAGQSEPNGDALGRAWPARGRHLCPAQRG